MSLQFENKPVVWKFSSNNIQRIFLLGLYMAFLYMVEHHISFPILSFKSLNTRAFPQSLSKQVNPFPVLVDYCFCNKLPQSQLFKARKIYYSLVGEELDTGRTGLKSRYWEVCVFSYSIQRRIHFLVFSSFQRPPRFIVLWYPFSIFKAKKDSVFLTLPPQLHLLLTLAKKGL